MRTVGLALGALLAAGCSATDEMASDAAPSPELVVWIANEGADSLSVLDGRTGRTLSTLEGVDGPHNVQLSRDGAHAWVTGVGGVVQVATGSLGVEHVAPAGAHPAHVVQASDGVLVTSYGDGSVHHFDEALVHRGSLRVGAGPHGLRIAPDGSFVAIADTAAGKVRLVDLPLDGTESGRARGERSVRVGPEPVQVAISPDSRRVYVSVAGTRKVVEIDAERARVTGEVAVSAAPAQVWVTDDGLVLSADQGTERRPGHTLSIIDTGSMQVVAEVPTGAGPHGVAVSPAGQTAWVTNAFDGTVTMVDLEDAEAVGTFPVGEAPNGISVGWAVPPEHPDTDLVMPHPYAPEDGHGHEQGSHGAESHHH